MEKFFRMSFLHDWFACHITKIFAILTFPCIATETPPTGRLVPRLSTFHVMWNTG